MKRVPTIFALAAFAALACACRPSAATQDGATATQQSLVSQKQPTPQQQPSPQSPRPNLCKGQKSPLPAPSGFVSDLAKVIDAEAEAKLESRLAEVKKSSGVEFAVVTVETTGGRDIFDYSLDVACGWGIGPGEGEPGGGVLLLVAVKDRRWRIQLSRSLEAALPDATVKEIGDRMAEHFRRGAFGEGITAAVEEHITRLPSDTKPDAPKPTP
jgi:uncharacterized protein